MQIGSDGVTHPLHETKRCGGDCWRRHRRWHQSRRRGWGGRWWALWNCAKNPPKAPIRRRQHKSPLICALQCAQTAWSLTKSTQQNEAKCGSHVCVRHVPNWPPICLELNLLVETPLNDGATHPSPHRDAEAKRIGMLRRDPQSALVRRVCSSPPAPISPARELVAARHDSRCAAHEQECNVGCSPHARPPAVRRSAFICLKRGVPGCFATTNDQIPTLVCVLSAIPW